MNTTAKRPTKALETNEATDPTMPETRLKLTNSRSFSIINATKSKSGPSFGKTLTIQSLIRSTGFDSRCTFWFNKEASRTILVTKGIN